MQKKWKIARYPMLSKLQEFYTILLGTIILQIKQKSKLKDNNIKTMEFDFMRGFLQLTIEDRIQHKKIWKHLTVVTCSIIRIFENKAPQ